ncbi:cobalt ECF transporter T component CbiQ [Pelotomaculum propionicicum]|uniref:cobalt ECF transporter T component CbiQ n=1 Tax=Pelotomaculum propionicicum TaxID=258475 RepID=UPI003B7B1A1D
MLLTERYALTNKLNNRHPAEKGCLTILCMAACLLALSPLVPLLVLAIMTSVTVLAGRIPMRVFFGLLIIPVSFLICGLFTMAFSINPSPACLFEFTLAGFKIGVTPAGMDMAAQTFCRSAGAVSCLCFFILTTPVTQVFSLLDRVPFPSLLLEVMILVYGSIMVLLDTAGKMVLSQSSRLGYSSAQASYRSLSWLVAKLFVHSLRRSREMYLGLASRGYEDRIRVVQPGKELSPLYLALAAASGSFLIYLALRTGGLSS